MASNEGANSLYEVPDAFIVTALALTTPKDACRLELASTRFRSLASSDNVWERFLPADYRNFLSRSPEGLNLLGSSMPKKELFLHVCDNPLLIDDGTKSFALDKASGKKNFMLGTRALSIIWSNAPQYWKFIPLPTSRFDSVAKLVAVCWFEIHGVINSQMLSPNTNYTFYLVFAVTPSFNWVSHPTEVSVGFSGQPPCKKQSVELEQRSDGWLEIELGEMYIKEGDEDGDIVVKLAEVESNQWKRGVVIEGIEIRAKMD